MIGDSDIFVGDALMNMIYPTKSLLYGNQVEMDKSADKISTFKSATVHFGHGKIGCKQVMVIYCLAAQMAKNMFERYKQR